MATAINNENVAPQPQVIEPIPEPTVMETTTDAPAREEVKTEAKTSSRRPFGNLINFGGNKKTSNTPSETKETVKEAVKDVKEAVTPAKTEESTPAPVVEEPVVADAAKDDKLVEESNVPELKPASPPKQTFFASLKSALSPKPKKKVLKTDEKVEDTPVEAAVEPTDSSAAPAAVEAATGEVAKPVEEPTKATEPVITAPEVAPAVETPAVAAAAEPVAADSTETPAATDKAEEKADKPKRDIAKIGRRVSARIQGFISPKKEKKTNPLEQAGEEVKAAETKEEVKQEPKAETSAAGAAASVPAVVEPATIPESSADETPAGSLINPDTAAAIEAIPTPVKEEPSPVHAETTAAAPAADVTPVEAPSTEAKADETKA